MFPRAAPAGYLNVNGDMVFTKSGGRIMIAATGSRAEQRTIFTAPPGQNTVFGAMPGKGGAQAVIQVYSKNLDPMAPSGFCYGDLRCGGGLAQVRLTSAALGPNSDGTGAPTVFPLCFFVNGISHLINADGSVSWNNSQTTIDASGNLTLTGNVQTPHIGIGGAYNTGYAAAVNICAGGILQFLRPDNGDSFQNYYKANDLLLCWDFNLSGTPIMTLDNGGNLTLAAGSLTSLLLSVTGISAHNVMIGQATGAVTGAAPGAAGTVLTSNGTSSDPSFQTSVSLGFLTRIGQVVCAGSQATVVFSSIPAGFTNLMVVFQCRDTTAGTSTSVVYLKMNADGTAANYDTSEAIEGSATTAAAGTTAATTAGLGAIISPNDGATAGLCAIGHTVIPNYAGTTFFKQVITSMYTLSGTTVVRAVYGYAGEWKSTAAIATLTYKAGTAFKDGSVFTLYGMP